MAAPIPVSSPAGPSQRQHQSTREASFDPRLSTSDLSLRTLPAYTTLPKDEERHLTDTSIMADKLSRQVFGRDRANRVDSTDGDGASFVTAQGTLRGTLRSVAPDGTATEEEVMVWIRPAASGFGAASTTPSALSSAQTIVYPDADETPLPSRVLLLHHPGRLAGPQGVQGKIDLFFELNSWTILDSAKNGVERAFWGLVMPSIAGIKGMSETVGDMIGSLTLPVILQLGSAPMKLASDPADVPSVTSRETPAAEPETPHQPRLYADETIYTLRLPAESAKELDQLDLGNTARPILVRKRGGLPAWDARLDEGMGWGREVGPSWR